MHRETRLAVLAALLAAVSIGGCAQPVPTPSASLGSPATSPSAIPAPTPTPLEGRTAIELTGRIRSPCAQPPSGCGHWIVLVLPGGETRRAAIERDPNAPWEGPARITSIGPELPTTIPEGRYGLIFEAAAYSDTAYETTLPDGSIGYPPPEPEIGCTGVLDTGSGPRTAAIRVVYEGFDCTISVTLDGKVSE